MTLTILGHGTAVPEHSITMDESVAIASQRFCPTDRERRILPALYRMAGVRKRHSVLLQERRRGHGDRHVDLMRVATGPDDMGPSIGSRMELYESAAFPLAARAARTAIEDAGLSGSDMTHMVTVSCSGFFAPGVDIKLIKELHLPRTIERAHVGFMGCHGALNGLRIARGFGGINSDANVLLCAVELCSLHYHYGWDAEYVVANALFADGAAAVVGSARPDSVGWSVLATGACLIPDSEDAMTWRIRDHGFVMTLSPKVPGLIEEHLPAWLESWLATEGLGINDIGTWAVHPGGPRILSSVARALGLDDDALAVSREVLRQYGNMSSPTILFVLDRLRQADAPLPCVALGFGPGLMAEAVLFA
jgi:predicted naringenin-chalcone synthase